MLNILTEDSVPVSFDIINMFSSIDNVFGLETVSEILENRETDFPPAECIFEALELCLKCNNVVFNEKFYLQEDGTAMEPHMSCSYSDIAIYSFNLKALSYTLKVFLQEIQKFFEFINSIATSSGNNVYVIMSIANNNSVLEFLDLSLHIMNTKRSVLMCMPNLPTISQIFLPSTCYPKKSVNKVPNGIALRLWKN